MPDDPDHPIDEPDDRERRFFRDLVGKVFGDSLDAVELVMEFEEEVDISIPDEAAEKIQTRGCRSIH